ncbi:conserved hypothetical protein [Ricinus communis]|uniref:Uncharacterized protein n=1 Tax=Ricinus communis TaxID=3988 RepID=B9SB67_RICCO|nr:conserved hypothetical protein [Ricinus communis]
MQRVYYFPRDATGVSSPDPDTVGQTEGHAIIADGGTEGNEAVVYAGRDAEANARGDVTSTAKGLKL